MILRHLPLFALLCAATTARSQVIITEFMANNTRTVADEDGAFNDWIELHNPTAAPVSMDGWSLTDVALEPDKWTFPDGVNIPARSYLLVWASNKDRRVAGSPLHTNFKLDGDGEYLALVKPDASVAAEFAPTFPPQVPDLSYGPAAQTTATTAIQQGTAGKVMVPADGSLGTTWTASAFDDTAWTPATNGIGFESGANEFGTGWTGEILADGPAGYYRLEETAGTTAVNQGGAGAAANGTYTGTVTLGVSGPLPPTEAGMPAGNKAFRMAGTGYIETAYNAALNPAMFTVECWARATGGAGTFRAAVSGRDDTGSQTKGYIFYAASNNTWQFWTGSGGSGVWDPITGPAVVLNTWVHLAGTYDGTTKRFYVNGTQVGTGTLSTFNINTARGLRIGAGRNENTPDFRFQGDLDEVAIYPRSLTAAEISARYALGKNNTAPPPVNDFSGLISSNLQAQMSGSNASAYFRLPFNVTDPAAVDGITLKMKYDDGFQAYLNGVPVAGGNVPAGLTWNSSASGRSSNSEAVVFESFSLNSALNTLQPGTNVLAIHGLNLDAANPDFLQLAQLELTDVGTYSTTPLYLTTATPGAVNSNGSTTPGPAIFAETLAPVAPTAADDLTITCRAQAVFAPVATVTLNWRTAYNTLQQTAMTDNGTAGDVTAGDGTFTAIIAKTNYTQGQMVRWYFTGADIGGNTSRWPVFTSGSAAPEYFGTMISATGFSTALPVWYWFAQNTAAAATRGGTRGSVFFSGELYDNVFIRQRGGATSTGSKKFDFNSGAHALINTAVGRVEEANLNGSSLGGADTIIRPAVAYELLRRSGHPSGACFPVMMRMNGALDSASGRGGVAYFVEQVDERYLRRHGFDDRGALYKMDQRSNLEPVFTDTTDGVQKRTRLTENNSDLQTLVNAVHSSSPEDWSYSTTPVPPVFPAGFTATRTTKLFDLMNMANLTNYLAARIIIGDTDDTRKNFYLYRDSEGDLEWRILPWDKDGTLGLALDAAPYVGHPFQADYAHRKINSFHQWNYLYEASFNEPKIRAMMLRRLRTLMDTVLEPAAGAPEALVDSVWAPIPATTPVLATYSGVTPASIKSFFGIRRTGAASTSTSSGLFTVYSAANGLGAGIQIPTAQPANALVTFGTIEFLPASGNQLEEYVQITNPNSYDVDLSGWYINGGISHTFEPGTVIRASDVMYLANNKNAFRARTASPHGAQDLFIAGGFNGSLSARGETFQLWDPMIVSNPTDDRLVTTGTYTPAPTPSQLALRITEIMYDPPAGGTFAAGEYEFLELMNTGATPLNLTGATFTDGISFTFGATTLNAGDRIVLVKNPAAFTERYGAAPVVAGTFTGALDNSGERLRLLDGMGEEVLDFRYEGAWYPSTHGSSSLVIEDMNAGWETWSQQFSWRASSGSQGAPGAIDPPPDAPVITGNNGATIHLTGTPGRSFLLQRSTDLSVWINLDLSVAQPDGTFDATDPAPPGVRAYYRVQAK